MAAFPAVSSVPYKNPFTYASEWRTAVNEFAGNDDSEEQRQQIWLYPRRNLTLAYEWISISEAATLFAFFNARKGRFEAFSFFWPFSSAYTYEFVGIGDGSTLIFNLPAKTSSGYTLYVNGMAQTAGGTDWTFGALGGTDGEDKATFVAAPSVGDIITFSFTGYLKIRARFDEDAMTFEEFYNRLVNTGVRLKGLKNNE